MIHPFVKYHDSTASNCESDDFMRKCAALSPTRAALPQQRIQQPGVTNPDSLAVSSTRGLVTAYLWIYRLLA